MISLSGLIDGSIKVLIEDDIVRDDNGPRSWAKNNITLLVHIEANEYASEAPFSLLPIDIIEGGPFSDDHGTSKGT